MCVLFMTDLYGGSITVLGEYPIMASNRNEASRCTHDYVFIHNTRSAKHKMTSQGTFYVYF